MPLLITGVQVTAYVLHRLRLAYSLFSLDYRLCGTVLRQLNL